MCVLLQAYTDCDIIGNTAVKLGGGLGNNTGSITLHGSVIIAGNHSNDVYADVYTNVDIDGEYVETPPSPHVPGPAGNVPVYEISAPAVDEMFAKTPSGWEFSAVSSVAIKDWVIDWGDGSETTQFLGGPRSRISVAHRFQEPGTYTITVGTTDFNGDVNTVVIGTYTIKPCEVEPETLLSDIPLQVEPAALPPGVSPMASSWNRSVNRIDCVTEISETMRLRQMLDLDGRNTAQKSSGVAFTEMIWSDEEWLDDSWLDFTDKTQKSDCWNAVFEEDLLLLKIGI